MTGPFCHGVPTLSQYQLQRSARPVEDSLAVTVQPPLWSLLEPWLVSLCFCPTVWSTSPTVRVLTFMKETQNVNHLERLCKHAKQHFLASDDLKQKTVGHIARKPMYYPSKTGCLILSDQYFLIFSQELCHSQQLRSNVL